MGHEHHHRRDRAREGMGTADGDGRMLRMHATLDSNQVADHLLALAQALRVGGGTLRSGGQSVVLRTGETVNLEVQAGEEGVESVVRLALRWRTPVPQVDREITPGLQTVASRPADPAYAHGGGLVLPGDPASPPAAAPAVPPSTETPGGTGPRERKGPSDRPHEA